YCQQTISIQRQEIDAGSAGLVADIGAQVQLWKAAGKWNRRQAAHLDTVHPERDYPDPCGPVKRVELQAVGDQACDCRGRNRPMRKKEVIPALSDHPASGGQWPRTL